MDAIQWIMKQINLYNLISGIYYEIDCFISYQIYLNQSNAAVNCLRYITTHAQLFLTNIHW